MQTSAQYVPERNECQVGMVLFALLFLAAAVFSLISFQINREAGKSFSQHQTGQVSAQSSAEHGGVVAE